MAALTTAGSTVFKFIRSEKTWRETGSGNVTFSVQTKRLMVSVDDLVYVVQGGVRRKGSKAVVMRVKEDSSKSKKATPESMIIAVRFECLKDTQHVLSLLKLTPWIRPRPRKKQPRGPPPAFFLAMSTRERENVRALISKAKQKYIEDGTIQRQLTVVYKMTIEQIEEAIDFFHPWLSAADSRRRSHYREHSFSRTDNSSLPSIGCGDLAPLGRKSSPRRVNALRAFPSNKSSQLLGPGVPQATHSRPGSTLMYSEVATAGAAVPNLGTHAHRRSEADISPFKLDTKKKEKHRRNTLEITDRAAKPSVEDFAGKITDANNKISKWEKTSEEEGKNMGNDRSLEIHSDGKESPLGKKQNSGPNPYSNKQSPVTKAISALTQDNLILHNRLLKPSKGDFKRLVSNWLKVSLPE